jgi:iron(III) transport system permease protein
MAILLSALFFTTLMPLLMLIIKSRNISFYVEALNRAGGSLARSIMFASAGAAALTFTGFLTGYLIHTKALRFWRAADLLTISVFALPGTVTGIGLILLWNTPVTNIIYSTPLIIIIGYVAKYTAVTSRITVAGLAQIPSSFDDAARNCGAGWFRRMIYINIPLLSRTLAGGWIAGYIFSMRETAITRIVYPAGSDTLPVRIFTLMANGSQELIAALCIIMILSVLLPAALLWFIPEFILKKRGLFKTWAP